MKFNVDRTTPLPKNVGRKIERRMQAARDELARQAVSKIADAVRQKIPSGGWFTIYREAIEYFESADGKRWGVAGLYPSALSRFDASESQVIFSGASQVAQLMAARNPWPIDMIPAYTGGYRAQAIVKHASVSEIDSHRKRLEGVIAEVKQELLSAGGAIELRGLPVIAGKVYADIAFLAMRLEHGLGGLPRRPVWLKTWNDLRNKMPGWTREALPRIEYVLRGSPSQTPVAAMPDELLRILRREA